jgi:hypothetical protein
VTSKLIQQEYNSHQLAKCVNSLHKSSRNKAIMLHNDQNRENIMENVLSEQFSYFLSKHHVKHIFFSLKWAPTTLFWLVLHGPSSFINIGRYWMFRARIWNTKQPSLEQNNLSLTNSSQNKWAPTLSLYLDHNHLSLFCFLEYLKFV